MNRATSSLLALLLVLSLTVVPSTAYSGPESTLSATSLQYQVATADGSTAGLQPVSNTTNRLTLEDGTETEYATYGPDLGATLTSADAELRIDHTQYVAIDRQFADATAEERRTLVQDAYDRLKARSDAIERREQQAVTAHSNGELSNRQLLQTLLRTHREAAALSEAFSELEERADQVPGVSVSVTDEQDKLEMFQTTIRSRLASVAAGSRMSDSTTYVSIQTSENGYVIETLDEDYLREATRFDNRDTLTETQFADLLEAYGHSSDLYPWAYDTGQSPSVSEYTTVQLYRIDITHEQGELKAYLDGGTGDIHRELQTLDPEMVPTVRQQEWQKDELKLTVDKTAANGPQKVTITDQDGEPVTATITISDVEVGETNADGSLWYIPPNSGYELTVERPTGSNVTVPVSNS